MANRSPGMRSNSNTFGATSIGNRREVSEEEEAKTKEDGLDGEEHQNQDTSDRHYQDNNPDRQDSISTYPPSSTLSSSPLTSPPRTSSLLSRSAQTQSETTLSTNPRQQQQIEHEEAHDNPPTSPSPSPSPSPTMSKLSEAVKALINASHAKPGYTQANPSVKPALERFAASAGSKKIGLPAWVTVSTAVSATLNCPEAMLSIYRLANSHNSSAVHNASLIREVGLKCISFNGIPRTINTLGAFRNSLQAEGEGEDVLGKLSKTPTREFTPENLPIRKEDGRALWDSVYLGFEKKLLDKLALSHPDLPVHIINGHYASLLSNPRNQSSSPVVVGRVLTSLVAIACLRAQTGVGPQVVSHIFGLRKAYENGDADAEGEVPVEGGEWLATTEEGNLWLLENVDRLVGAIGGDGGTTFAPGIRAKL